jgi:hypothetical protein
MADFERGDDEDATERGEVIMALNIQQDRLGCCYFECDAKNLYLCEVFVAPNASTEDVEETLSLLKMQVEPTTILASSKVKRERNQFRLLRVEP